MTQSDCHGYVVHTTQFYNAFLDHREIYNDVPVATGSDSTDTYVGYAGSTEDSTPQVHWDKSFAPLGAFSYSDGIATPT